MVGIVLSLCIIVMLFVGLRNMPKPIKILALDDDAFWYEKGQWYTAEIIDNEIDLQTAQVIDIMSLSDEDADALMEIAEILKDGE